MRRTAVASATGTASAVCNVQAVVRTKTGHQRLFRSASTVSPAYRGRPL